MRTVLITIIIIMITMNSISARKGVFGKMESIKEIQELDVSGPKGEDLYLAYRTSSSFFIAGLYFKDHGYVLGIRGQYNSYYPLDARRIAQLQEAGQLPDPMPEYDIPWKEYLFGYSGWLILPLLFWRLLLFFKNMGDDTTERKKLNDIPEWNYNMGLKNYNPKKGRPDYKSAFKLFKKAAEQGHIEALYNTGIMLCKGQGIEQDLDLGYKYLTMAEQKGHKESAIVIKKHQELNQK
ncbi:tetratricopeptide repeat protein [Arenibacter sp. ARW7G5Y1]|uniref:tetratricopeptide repeat protein n=1 Tax=Arenibacter sp. ARW7G5Y1 TaxID=2135619 RepID=UPI000D75A5F5|nr:SEL1-like repeat protein [Arenibacter sp. ARW7G5Y1]PXX31210.1 Sel1 repeat-containing protein [Arenibacter sp. ARW7G5Y1]